MRRKAQQSFAQRFAAVNQTRHDTTLRSPSNTTRHNTAQPTWARRGRGRPLGQLAERVMAGAAPAVHRQRLTGGRSGGLGGTDGLGLSRLRVTHRSEVQKYGTYSRTHMRADRQRLDSETDRDRHRQTDRNSCLSLTHEVDLGYKPSSYHCPRSYLVMVCARRAGRAGGRAGRKGGTWAGGGAGRRGRIFHGRVHVVGVGGVSPRARLDGRRVAAVVQPRGTGAIFDH